MSEPWSNDDQFEDVELKNVRQDGDGWVAERVDGWSFFIPAGDVKPAAGSTARLYGKGIGYPIRGLFIDGVKSFYRTEAEDETHRECERYGTDAADLLARWDAGKSVFTVERGGLGPGYEQAIQAAMFEALRQFVAAAPDASAWASDAAAYEVAIDEMGQAVLPIVEPLGLSGAQWGAARSLAARIYRDGPRATIKDAPDEMRIQVSRNFPSLAQAGALTPYDHICRADALLHAAYDTPCEPGDEAWHKQQAHGLIHEAAARCCRCRDPRGPGRRVGAAGPARAVPMTAPADPTIAIPDRYVTGVPTRQKAADIFRGAWISGLPDGVDSGGKLPLFADPRMAWFLERLGDISTSSVAELGPFEGGHSYMLHKAGARSILAIEASTLSYLKTLDIKEMYDLDRLRVRCGEAEAWLEVYTSFFDVIVASGVLYHFKRPLLALYHMSQRAETLCIWTHYVDHDACPSDDPRAAPFTGAIERDNVRGFEVDGYVRSYQGTQANAGFCGGVGAGSVWLKGEDIVAALERWGFEVEIGMSEPGHPNGPAAAFFARRRVRRDAL